MMVWNDCVNQHDDIGKQQESEDKNFSHHFRKSYTKIRVSLLFERNIHVIYANIHIIHKIIVTCDSFCRDTILIDHIIYLAGFMFFAFTKGHDIPVRIYTMRTLWIISFLIPAIGYSQTDTTDFYELSFTELAKIKIVSASKVSQDISEVSSTVFVLTAREIEQRGYLTLDDVLSDMPGFQFRNIQSINSYIFQRGIPNQNNLTLILIDGVQVNELNSGGFYAGGQYNLSNVERIEVIHGPSSVAYGTNAVSGIINIITRGHDENRIGVSTLAGSFNTIKSDFGYTWLHASKPLSLSVSGMVKSTDKSDLRGKAGDNNWSDLMDNFERNYALDLKVKSGKFILGSNYLHKQASGAAYVKSTGTSYHDHGTLWNLRFLTAI